MIFVLSIIVCSMIGTVIFIGICTPLSSAIIPTSIRTYNQPTPVIEEPFKDGCYFTEDYMDDVSIEKEEEDNTRTNLRKWIASSSIPTLRSRGMDDAEIKSELLRDFNLTEEEVERMLDAQ